MLSVGEARSTLGRPLRGLTLALVLLLLPVAGAQGHGPSARPARAATRGPVIGPSTPVARGSGYLALGDSVTFGYQEPQVVPTPAYRSPASFPGYPEQLGAELHLRVANLACPGETAASLVNQHAPSNGCENAYRVLFPLHVAYRGSQLAAAVAYLRHHPSVRLVSLMIGANDLARCRSVTPDQCTSQTEQDAVLAAVKHDIRLILSGLRTKGGYHGQIVILNYFALDYASALVRHYSVELNQAQDIAARSFHVRVADGFGEFQRAAARFGGSPCGAGLLTQLGAVGKCGVHPSYGGQALLTKAVAAATIL